MPVQIDILMDDLDWEYLLKGVENQAMRRSFAETGFTNPHESSLQCLIDNKEWFQ